MTGRDIENTLSIPETALTRSGFVWMVDDTDHLQRLAPKILFRRHDRIVIRAPEGGETWRVAVTPLASFLPGQRVQPSEAEG